MNELDLELFRAWHRVRDKLQDDPEEAAKRAASSGQSTYARPVRSWCLVLRANDKRIDTHCAMDVVEFIEWDEDSPQCAVEAVELTGDAVRELCAPVRIIWPGVSIDEAARIFGVNRTTILRWGNSRAARKNRNNQYRKMSGFEDSQSPASPDGVFPREPYTTRTEGRLVIDWYRKGNSQDLHRAIKRVWTPRPVDPAGHVWAADWGGLIVDLTHHVCENWSQTVHRTYRLLSPGTYTRFVACPNCRKWCYKLYWPQQIWTVSDAQGVTSGLMAASHHDGPDGFVCRRCAKLIYESAERTSKPAPGRTVNTWNRFIKRISAGWLDGGDVSEQYKETWTFQRNSEPARRSVSLRLAHQTYITFDRAP